MSLKTYISLFLLTISAVPSAAQSDNFSFEIFGFEAGLSHRDVTKIQQDSAGFIRLATVNGLNKYDGYDFLHYKADNSDLSQNYISDALVAPDGKLWLSHPNEISLFDVKTELRKNIKLNRAAARGKEQTAYHLTAFAGGVLSAAFEQETGESRLLYVSEKGFVQDLKKLQGKYALHPLVVLQDTIFVGAAENELRFFTFRKSGDTLLISKKQTYQTFPFRDGDAGNSRILHLQKTKNNTLWLLAEGGQFFRKTSEQNEFTRHPVSDLLTEKKGIHNFFIDRSGNFWFGGRGVLLEYNQKTEELYDRNSLIQQTTKYAPNYRQIYQDRSDVVWLATDLGAIKIARSDRLFTNYLNDGNEYCSSGFCSMRGMCEDAAGNVYFTYYNSIHKLEKETGVLMPLFPGNNYRHPPFGLAYADGALWTGNGLRIDLATLHTDTIFFDRTQDKGVVVADRNQLWFGYENSLTQYLPATQTKIEYAGKNWAEDIELEITFLHKGQHSGDFWLGTNASGLWRMNRAGQITKRYTAGEKKNALSENRILGAYENADGNVWVATAAGLDLLHPAADSTRHFTVDDGLPNNFINAVLAESDSIAWATTDNGLTRIDLRNNQIDNFFEKDGLPANEFNRNSALAARDGRLYFGGMNGVTAFYPDENLLRSKSEKKSRVMLTGFAKYDGLRDSLVRFSAGIQPDSQLDISWRDRFFTFNFSLSDFNNPFENRYSYLLEGHDKNWSESAKANSARYSNLPAGRYVFRVRGAAGTDDWEAEELRIPLVVEEAFFRTKTFIVLCVLLTAALVFGIMRYRLHLIQKREQTLEAQVRERTRELEAEKQVSEDLLLNILPAQTAEELKKNGTAKAKRHETVTVFFSDFKDFSKIAEQMEPEQLVAEIDHCFRAFDDIAGRFKLEKIKTIGDAYMCTAGLQDDGKKAARRIVEAALEMQKFMRTHAEERRLLNRPLFEARIGLHTGPVVAGIVGSKKFAYDIWGDTVNIASRMESHGEVGRVNISQSTYELIKDDFACEHRGKSEVKNKGEVDMYFVEKQEKSTD